MCGSLGTNDICTDYLIVEFVVSNDNDALRVRVLFYFTAHLVPPKTCLQAERRRRPLPSSLLSISRLVGRSSFITTSQKFSAGKKFCRPHHKSPTPLTQHPFDDFLICLFMKSFQLARSAYFHFSNQDLFIIGHWQVKDLFYFFDQLDFARDCPGILK